MTQIKSMILDRATWRNGRYCYTDHISLSDKREFRVDNTCLYNSNGLMCCLGQLGFHIGISKQNMLYVLSPEDYCSHFGLVDGRPWPEKLFDTPLAGHDPIHGYNKINETDDLDNQGILMAINDAKDVDDEIREAWIKAGFWYLLDIDLNIEGEYPELISLK